MKRKSEPVEPIITTVEEDTLEEHDGKMWRHVRTCYIDRGKEGTSVTKVYRQADLTEDEWLQRVGKELAPFLASRGYKIAGT